MNHAVEIREDYDEKYLSPRDRQYLDGFDYCATLMINLVEVGKHRDLITKMIQENRQELIINMINAMATEEYEIIRKLAGKIKEE